MERWAYGRHGGSGCYEDVAGRFEIKRRGHGKWRLTDRKQGKSIYFDTFREAQTHAEYLRGKDLKAEFPSPPWLRLLLEHCSEFVPISMPPDLDKLKNAVTQAFDLVFGQEWLSTFRRSDNGKREEMLADAISNEKCEFLRLSGVISALLRKDS